MTKLYNHLISTQSQKVIVEIRNLCKKFIVIKENKNEEKIALNNLSFNLSSGKIYGLIGVNGSGKSTLLKILAGQYTKTSGNILYQQEEIEFISLEKLGYLPEHIFLPNRNVLDILFYFCDIMEIGTRKEIYSWIKYFSDFFDFSEFLNHSIHELSAGNIKKIGLTTVFLKKPEILLLDEPTANLDPLLREKLYKLIYEIHQDKIILISSHSLNELYDIITDIIIIHKGEIRFIGKKEDFNTEKSKYNYSIVANPRHKVLEYLKLSKIDFRNTIDNNFDIFIDKEDFSSFLVELIQYSSEIQMLESHPFKKVDQILDLLKS